MNKQEDSLFEAAKMLAVDFMMDYPDTEASWSLGEAKRFVDGINLGFGIALKSMNRDPHEFALEISQYVTDKALRRLK